MKIRCYLTEEGVLKIGGLLSNSMLPPAYEVKTDPQMGKQYFEFDNSFQSFVEVMRDYHFSREWFSFFTAKVPANSFRSTGAFSNTGGVKIRVAHNEQPGSPIYRVAFLKTQSPENMEELIEFILNNSDITREDMERALGIALPAK